MFKNNLNPPPKKKSFSNVQTKCNNDIKHLTTEKSQSFLITWHILIFFIPILKCSP